MTCGHNGRENHFGGVAVSVSVNQCQAGILIPSLDAFARLTASRFLDGGLR